MEDILQDHDNETTKYQLKNKKLREGAVLIYPAEKNKSLFLLREGSVEILDTELDVSSNQPPKIMMSSSRVSIIEAESIFGELQIIGGSKKPLIVRALEDCIITLIDCKDRFDDFITESPKLGLKILELLINRYNDTNEYIGRINSFMKKLQKISDNTALVLCAADPEINSKTKSSSIDSPLRTYATQIMAKLEQSGYNFPDKIHSRFILNEDFSNELRKSYGTKVDTDASDLELQIYELFNKFLSVEGVQLNQFVYTEPTLISDMCKILTNLIEQKMDAVYESYSSLNKSFATVAGKDQSFITEMIELAERAKDDHEIDNTPINQALKQLISVIDNINSEYFGLFGKDYPALSTRYKSYSIKIQEDKKRQELEERKKRRDREVSFPEECRNSLQQILDYSELPAEEQKRFLKELDKFKSLNAKFDTSMDYARIRRRIAMVYWKIYKQSFLKYKKTGDLPRVIEMMFRYGYLDEELCTEEDVYDLYNLKDESDPEFPIWDIFDWLNAIYSRDVYPSINEFGETFRQLRKRELGKNYDPAEEEEESQKMSEMLVSYEIDSVLRLASTICSGNPRAAFPIFCSELMIRGDVESVFFRKDKFSDMLSEILDVDFSAFYREIVFRMDDKRVEFPKKEVIPNFIIVPVIGSRIQMWQTMEGTQKSSRGRLFAPSFLIEDVELAVLRAVGGYRFELSKDLAGAMWMHPVDGGLAGQYYDYMTYFKKNPNLSMEAKEKIANDFKRYRTTRDRFVNDYVQWMRYEKDGILRLNKVTREIFYKNVPFKKAIRDKLASFPAYEEIHRRFTNIMKRELTNLKARYHKYTKDGGELPEELQSNLDFYTV